MGIRYVFLLHHPLLWSVPGLFVDNNIPHWKVYRKVMAPVFHFKNLKHYIPIFHDESLILMEKLSEFSSSGESLYPPKFMELVTFSSIMRTAVGVNLYAQFEEPHPVVEALNNVLEVRITREYVVCGKNLKNVFEVSDSSVLLMVSTALTRRLLVWVLSLLSISAIPVPRFSKGWSCKLQV